MNHLGSTLKKIREDKGLSQKYVSKDIMTQSNYSRFENGQIDISSTAFLEILIKFDITFEELNTIYQNNNFRKRRNIIADYYGLTYNNLNELTDLVRKISIYKPDAEDTHINHIKLICESLIDLITTHDLELARINLGKVWNDLSKRNKLYIADIYILNSILFYFPLDTAKNILSFMNLSLRNYKKNKELERLELNTLINFSLLLVKSKEYSEALSTIEKVITLCNKYGEYLRLGICYVRKGIVLSHLKNNNSKSNFWIKKGLLILKELQCFDIIETLEIEIANYKNHD